MGSGAAQEHARELQQHAAEKTASLARLAAGIAHELRNPLAVILARAQLFQLNLKNGGPLDADKLRRVLGIIEEQAIRAARIIEHLSVFARPRTPQLERLDLLEAVDGILASLRAQMPQPKALVTDVDVAADARFVHADGGQIRTALTQLVQNAIQAMPDGGTLHVHIRRSPAGVEITVADTGGGMAAHDVPRIFDPFFSTRPGAPGLGLCVAQTIAEAHGGSLRLVDTSAAGTEFRLTLPVRG